MTSLPWLMTAVPREHRAFRRDVVATLRRRPTSLWRCRRGDVVFLLGETGVGCDMVRETLDWIAARESPRFIFLAGFAGALADDLRVGDAVAATGVAAPDGAIFPAGFVVDAAIRAGTLLTADRLVESSADKRRLGIERGALAVDMETSHLAVWCLGRGVPWGCVRAVSDDVLTPVSKDVFEILEGGRVSPWRLARSIARRPSLAAELLRLGRSTSVAARAVALALDAAIASDPPA